jgi:hypothetical protein
MTNDGLREERAGTDVVATGRERNGARVKDRPTAAVAVVPLWARPRTGVRR